MTFFLPCQRRHPELPKIPTYLPHEAVTGMAVHLGGCVRLAVDVDDHQGSVCVGVHVLADVGANADMHTGDGKVGGRQGGSPRVDVGVCFFVAASEGARLSLAVEMEVGVDVDIGMGDGVGLIAYSGLYTGVPVCVKIGQFPGLGMPLCV